MCAAIIDVLSRKFGFKRGVKQGDPLSPLFFNSVLEGIFAELKPSWESKGYGMNISGQTLTNLRFADDVLLIGTTLEAVRQMLQDLATTAEKYGLSLHYGKTKKCSAT